MQHRAIPVLSYTYSVEKVCRNVSIESGKCMEIGIYLIVPSRMSSRATPSVVEGESRDLSADLTDKVV